MNRPGRGSRTEQTGGGTSTARIAAATEHKNEVRCAKRDNTMVGHEGKEGGPKWWRLQIFKAAPGEKKPRCGRRNDAHYQRTTKHVANLPILGKRWGAKIRKR